MTYSYKGATAHTAAEVVGTDTVIQEFRTRRDARIMAEADMVGALARLAWKPVKVGRWWRIQVEDAFWLDSHGWLWEKEAPE